MTYATDKGPFINISGVTILLVIPMILPGGREVYEPFNEHSLNRDENLKVQITCRCLPFGPKRFGLSCTVLSADRD